MSDTFKASKGPYRPEVYGDQYVSVLAADGTTVADMVFPRGGCDDLCGCVAWLADRLNLADELDARNHGLQVSLAHADTQIHKLKNHRDEIVKAAIEYGGICTQQEAEDENCVSCQGFWEVVNGKQVDHDDVRRQQTDRILELEAEVERLKEQLADKEVEDEDN
jgi:hypothetical protein